ncbi:MAG TPA: mandelate racemase/muconate lactonizing enzyme family protein [Candidatus Acidoferrales bacterium]|nr:mandelate racemase/muconate lactonizing enzyme family protein [Candidatus Acidoferrales bacterium]
MAGKIVKAETKILSVPLERPVEGHPYLGRRAASNFLLLELKTEDGLEAFGLAHTSTVGKARALEAIVREALPLLAGRGALEHERVYERAYAFFTDLGHSGAALQALAAIDIALWDLKGKALGQPLWRLLGARSERVPCYASGGLRRHQSIDQLIADASDFVRRGFRAMKLRLGARPFAEDVERVRAVRDTVGSKVDLMVDLNWSLTPPEAIRLGRLLEPFNLYWIEDPVAPADIDGLAQVSRALDTRVTFGETLEKIEEFRTCLEKRAADCYMADVQKLGGIGAWMRAAFLLDAWHVPIASHVEPEVQVHLVAAAPNGLTVEYNPNHEVLYRDKLNLVDGFLELPQKPGLGFDLNIETIEKYQVA